MNRKKMMCILLAAGLLTGCRAKPEQSAPETTELSAAETTAENATEPETQTETTATAAAPEPYTFNPHLYSPKLSAEIPQDHWDSFYHLCDALRKGEDTFACSSQAAYDFATDPSVLAHLLPPACMKVTGESSDQTVPFENGTGRIFYNMPAADYVKRQAEFEELVTDVLNQYLEPDDDDYEKCLKLYNYMESNYVYEDFPNGCGDGAYYYTFMTHKGVCDELSGVYMYLLMQAGVEALEIGCEDSVMAHAWTYVILDGKGYHIDPTWALMSYNDTDRLSLEYFMMTDEHRMNDNCSVEDLTVDLLPQYWANQSSLTFPASDDRYYAKDYAVLDSLDEQNKIMHYTDMYGESHVLHYGKQ